MLKDIEKVFSKHFRYGVEIKPIDFFQTFMIDRGISRFRGMSSFLAEEVSNLCEFTIIAYEDFGVNVFLDILKKYTSILQDDSRLLKALQSLSFEDLEWQAEEDLSIGSSIYAAFVSILNAYGKNRMDSEDREQLAWTIAGMSEGNLTVMYRTGVLSKKLFTKMIGVRKELIELKRTEA